MSTYREPEPPSAAAGSGADAARAAGWAWLATLPRAAGAHAARGEDPQAAVRGLLAALGNPHRDLRVVHIAGSKGKGSTALLCEALLQRLGRRTLAYTSPHLARWTERLRIDGREVDARRARDALDAVRAAADRSGIVPGFFEALTVAGLLLAARADVDWAIIEAGVGGRADATNVVTPALSVLTGFELEHTERLGPTLADIAREKAGIIKPGAAAVAAGLDDDTGAIVRDAAARAGSELVTVAPAARPVRAAPGPGRVAWHRDGARLSAAGPGWAVRAPLAAPGRYVAANAALALAAVARLGLAPAERLQRAAAVLGEVVLPGRGEIVSRLPWVLVDGAHTAASARALAETVTALQPARVHLLLSLSQGKDVAAVLDPLLPLAAAATATCADRDYSLAADALARSLRTRAPPLEVTSAADPDAALARACAERPGETLVVATGSVYLAGRVRAAFAPEPG